MKSPILGGAYVARSVNAADNRMVNLYPEAIPEGGKEAGFLTLAPGLRWLQTIGTGPIRALWSHMTYGSDCYIVSGQEVYQLDNLTGAFPRLLGTISGYGPVSIADNGSQMFFACNPDAYIYDESVDTFSKVVDPDFPGAVTVAFINGYFIFNEPDSQKVWATALYDGVNIDALDYASAEGMPDPLMSVASSHKELWLFGANSTEIWYDAGGTSFPFAPIQGAFIEHGCAAAFSVAKMDNSLFWLGMDARGRGMVFRAQGYTPVRVSTHAVEWAIQSYSSIADAIGYTYQQDGHVFYVLNFPTGNTTWVYDAATNLWHERAGFSNGAWLRHASNCQTVFENKIIVGDYRNGNIYELDMNTHNDFQDPLRWLRSWRALPTGQNNLKRSAHHNLQLDCESGVGKTNIAGTLVDWYAVSVGILRSATGVEPLFLEVFDGRKLGDIVSNGSVTAQDALAALKYYNGALADVAQVAYIEFTMQPILLADPLKYRSYLLANAAADPQVCLRWSDDGGHTWSNEHWRSMGARGQYGTRVIWRRLGMTTKLRDRVYEVSGSADVGITINGAELFVTPTGA